jgi:hypothetical protein
MHRLPHAVTDRLAEFVTEANDGPHNGGIAGQVVVGDRVVDLAASRGWGVQVCVGARAERVHTDVTVDTVASAIGRLLAA